MHAVIRRERVSRDAEGSRLPHREVTVGLLRPPLHRRGGGGGGTKQPTSVLEQILGRKGVSDRVVRLRLAQPQNQASQ